MKLHTITAIVLLLLLHTPKTATSQTTDSSSTNIDTTTAKKSNPYLRDFGVWFGVSAGFLASGGGSIDKRLSMVARYELRSNMVLSLFGEVHIFKNGENHSVSNSIIRATVGPKLRFRISDYNLCIEAGIGYFVYIAFLQYSTSIEYLLSDNVILSLTQKSYANDNHAHFFQLGITFRTRKQ